MREMQVGTGEDKRVQSSSMKSGDGTGLRQLFTETIGYQFMPMH